MVKDRSRLGRGGDRRLNAGDEVSKTPNIRTVRKYLRTPSDMTFVDEIVMCN